jgi:hypothetical protein
MGPSVVLPSFITIAVGLAAGRLHRQLRPSLAAAGYTFLAALAAVAVASTILMFALLVLVRLPFLSPRLAWCSSLTSGHELPFWIATAIVAGLVAMVFSTWRTARRVMRPFPISSGDQLVVLPTDTPTAYAVPGRPGQIVVSAGMLRRLDADERRVLLAHERAHLRGRHHRYLRVVDLATAAVPVLDPLRRRVRFATERWADEEAAAAVGDRTLVARAICRAALAQHDGLIPSVMAMSGDDVGERVEAMLRPAVARGLAAPALVAMGLALAAGVVSSAFQLHHIAMMAEHICGLA